MILKLLPEFFGQGKNKRWKFPKTVEGWRKISRGRRENKLRRKVERRKFQKECRDQALYPGKEVKVGLWA